MGKCVSYGGPQQCTVENTNQEGKKKFAGKNIRRILYVLMPKRCCNWRHLVQAVQAC